MKLLIAFLTPFIFAQISHASVVYLRRAEFRATFEKIATESQASPLNCVQVKLGQGGPEQISYSLTVNEDGNYQDAFSVHFFATGTDKQWSTLVAYEGKLRHILGELTVMEAGTQVTLQHRFDGFFTDFLSLTVVDSKVSQLSYRKLNRQQVEFFSLKCSL